MHQIYASTRFALFPKKWTTFFSPIAILSLYRFSVFTRLKTLPLADTLRFSQSLLQLTIKYILFLTTFTHSGLSSHTCRVHFMEMTFLREKKCSIFMPNLSTKNLRNICHAFWNEQVSMSHLAFVRVFSTRQYGGRPAARRTMGKNNFDSTW